MVRHSAFVHDYIQPQQLCEVIVNSLADYAAVGHVDNISALVLTSAALHFVATVVRRI